MSGTEFEKAAGREKAKKWKTSVRVKTEDGKQGEMVGDWLQVHLTPLSNEPSSLSITACIVEARHMPFSLAQLDSSNLCKGAG